LSTEGGDNKKEGLLCCVSVWSERNKKVALPLS